MAFNFPLSRSRARPIPTRGEFGEGGRRVERREVARRGLRVFDHVVSPADGALQPLAAVVLMDDVNQLALAVGVRHARLDVERGLAVAAVDVLAPTLELELRERDAKVRSLEAMAEAIASQS